MAIPFSVHKIVHTIVGKTMKFLGQKPREVGIFIGAILGKITNDKLEKEKSKYKYKDWVIYRKGDFVYAKKGKDKIIKKTNELKDLEKLIDSAS